MFFSEDNKRCYTYIKKTYYVGKSADYYSLTEDFVNCAPAEWIQIPVYETIGEDFVQIDIDFTDFRG